ncbi:hypothetical protein MY1884_004743 [Beauveria asiatica]
MSVDLTRRFNSLEEAEVALRNTGVHTVTSRTKQDVNGAGLAAVNSAGGDGAGGDARPRAYQRFTGAVELEEIGLEAIEEVAAEPADLGSPASEAASGSAFAGAEGS